MVSWSGHYVRDPFHLQRLQGVERMLRRESHPFYRILRDSGLSRPNVLIAVLAGTLLVGIIGGFTEFMQSDPVLSHPSRSLVHPTLNQAK